ncbi:reverse transcriptase family protein [Methylobacterium sp. Leaf125]|uniref:reverse transcriptase family protein n=1 Tax=Methylobacterium sp. Leaf125 TaxID=1736265 RepID=UPI0009EBCBB6|nr:reverse transcriptase family protein [Methylobacterium sp. Leaf125]
MTIKRKEPSHRSDRYELEASPLYQKPTQKQFAELVGLSKSKLRGLIDHKKQYIIRRDAEINGKKRRLVYPFGKFRSVHEKLKFHLNKIIQPAYLYSPRKGRNQRSNAVFHLGQTQYLKLDIKQFYPSTSSEHVFRWAKYDMRMSDDVAGLLVHIATIDDVVSFGSPLTPVLATLVHRRMFNAIAEECSARGLRISLWVDDIVISGKFIPGPLVSRIRDLTRSNGLKSHKLEYFTGYRRVTITGVVVKGDEIHSPRKLHTEISNAYGLAIQSNSRIEAEAAVDRLLSTLGRYRVMVGKGSPMGRRASSRMNAIRQKRVRFVSERCSTTD